MLAALFLSACEVPGDCEAAADEPSIEVGYAEIGDWTGIETGDPVLVEPGSQGSGLMVQVNLRLVGLPADLGAFSDVSVQLFQGDQQLTADGSRTLSAVCTEDGTLLSRNRRIEFDDRFSTLGDLDKIDEGFEAELLIEATLQDGTFLESQVPVFLHAD